MSPFFSAAVLLTALLAVSLPTAAETPLPRTLAQGLQFPEGPAVSPDGKALYVVNVQGSFLSRIDLQTLALTREWMTLPDGGRGNGAVFGPDGALYVADVGRKRIVRISVADRTETTLADKTETGAARRGPNDLTFDKKGGLYFTDTDGSWGNPAAAVYYLAPKTHAVSLIAEGLQFPNGLALSPDGKTLYVAESPRHRVMAVDLKTRSLRVFATVAETGGPDGMRMGRDGFLYAAIFGEGIIAKISPSGQVARRIPVAAGKHCTNLCFGPGERSLFVTETDSNSVVQIGL